MADVVVVGAGTMRAEGYAPARLGPEHRTARQRRGLPPVPPIAVVTRSCRLEWSSPFFTEAEQRPVVITVASAETGDPQGNDGLAGNEGASLPCSFWPAQALAADGQRAEADDVFAATTGFANSLGLYPEEIDPATNGHLGNYPRALTHAALVQAALALGRP